MQCGFPPASARLRRGDAVFVLDLDALNRRIVGVDRCPHAVAQEGGQRMLRQRRHGAGLDVGGQAGLDADAVFRQKSISAGSSTAFTP